MANGRFEVELTQGAEDDFEAIFDYLVENRSVEAATELLDTLLAKLETLERYPQRGSIPKELEALGIREFRQILLSPYRLIYHVAADKVFIMLIADGRRDMQALMESRLLRGGT